jgi:hypothetical protein
MVNFQPALTVEDILKTHVPEPIKPELRRDIDRLIAEHTKAYDLRRLEASAGQHPVNARISSSL